MVGLQPLELRILVRIQVPEPTQENRHEPVFALTIGIIKNIRQTADVFIFLL